MKKKRRITKTYFDFACCQYAPLIHKLSFTIGIDATQAEELRVRAKEELLKCMICYDRRGSFMTFLYCRLVGIFKHIRDAEYRARRVKTISVDSIINIAQPDCDMDFNMMVQECLECLNDEERDVIMELFFSEKTIREISDDCGSVVSTIYRIKTDAINKMRQKCGA